MEMKRCTAAILLMLSLEALVSAAAVADDGVDTIRLPSHGLADEIATAVAKETVGEKSVADGEEDPSPPWKCCDLSRCTRSMPPSCSCLDEVKCAKGCKNCEKAVRSNGASTRYICRDTYGKVAPPCTNKTVAADVRRVSTGNADAASEKTVADGEEDVNPWKCCDLPRCTRSIPPTCQCLDKVKNCAKTCKKCEKAVGSNDASSSYFCLDTYSKPGPPCPKTITAGVGRGI